MSGVPHCAFWMGQRRWEVFEVLPGSRATRQHLARHLSNGWLAFHSNGERRRLAPIPTGWFSLPLSGLRSLLDQAVVVVDEVVVGSTAGADELEARPDDVPMALPGP